MGTPLGPKCIPYTYMDPLGYGSQALGLELAEYCAISLRETFLKRVFGSGFRFKVSMFSLFPEGFDGS